MRAFEYLHIFIDIADYDFVYDLVADPVFDETGKISLSDSDLLSDQLTQLGKAGWELVNITPEWKWTSKTVQQEHVGETKFGYHYYVDAPYSVPDSIQGWHCTFKRGISDEQIRN
jgi:hypothetical protein